MAEFTSVAFNPSAESSIVMTDNALLWVNQQQKSQAKTNVRKVDWWHLFVDIAMGKNYIVWLQVIAISGFFGKIQNVCDIAARNSR